MQNDVIEGFRLSPQQRRLWALQRGGGNPSYSSRGVLTIEGPLSADLLRGALRQVVRRHEILRTTYAFLPGMTVPVQVIGDDADVPFERRDLTALDAALQEQEVERLFDERPDEPFDLERGPLVRATLAALAPDRHALVLTLPSLCADSAALGLLAADLAGCYDALAAGVECEGESVQYADVCEVLNELLESDEAEAGREHWRRQDFSALAARLPLETSGGAAREFTRRRVAFEVEAGTAPALDAIAGRHGVTPDVLLLACWHVLLWKLTGQPQVIVGAAYDARNFQEIESVVGLFARHLPVACRLDAGTPLADVLEQVSEACAEAYEWQEYFAWEHADEARAADAGESFFPFAFEYEQAGGPFKAGGLSFTLARRAACVERYKVNLRCVRSDDATLAAELHYDAAALDAAEAERLARRFGALLRSVAEDPAATVGQLEILDDDERRQLLVEFNRTEAPAPEGKCVHEIFEEHAARAPESIAVIHDGQELTYGELNARANRLAHRLREWGVGVDVLVGICAERGPEMVVAILAVLKAGGAYVPLSPGYPKDRLAFMIEDSGVRVLLAGRGADEALPAETSARVVRLDSGDEEVARQSDENPRGGATERSLAYVIYTSGTTGQPKGVMVEHRGVTNLARWQADNFRLTPASRIAQFFSYSFDGAVGETFMALLNGAALVMLDSEGLEPRQLTEAVNRHGVNVGVFVPSMLRHLDPDALERPEAFSVVSVGEACPKDLAAKWAARCDFMNGYGPTEYTVYSHLWRVAPGALDDYEAVPIGTPIHNTRTYILDGAMRPAPVGVAGEIHIAGRGLARGYLNRPQLSGERFIPNPFLADDKVTHHGVLAAESARREMEEFVAGDEHARRASDDSARPDTPPRLSPAEVLGMVEGLDADVVETTARFVERYGRNALVYEGFCRYLLEGARDSYAARGINREVLGLVLGQEDWRGLRGVELGFGNAEIMSILAAAGAEIKGFDLSPFFVQRARRKGLPVRMAKVDVDTAEFVEECGVEEGSQDFALTTMVLDRIENPRNLLRNLFLCLKPGGRYAVQTILPVMPVDDGDVSDPITYTPAENRITPGRSVAGDKRALVKLLDELGASDVHICEVPYVISSRDGLQYYRVWSFYGRKAAAGERERAAEVYGRLYKTGDLGRFLPDGRIEFLGRLDEQVKLRGFRIELGEIESVLREHAGVADAVVNVWDDGEGAKRLTGYVVASDGAAPSVTDLRRFLESRLPDYMIPASFVTLDALPLTPNGKVDRKALPAPDESRPELKRAYEPPATPAERLLADIWAQLLRLDRVGTNDNFFELGGDSILAIQVIARANQEGLRLSPRDLFQHQTVARLAAVAGEGSGASAAQGVVTGPATLTPIQHWFFEQRLPDPHHFNQAVMLEVRSPLDFDLLREAVRRLHLQHDALRWRSVPGESGWSHFYAEPGDDASVVRSDLSGLDAGEQTRAVEREAEELQKSLSITDGPVLAAALFELGEGRPGRLFLVAHHMAVDIVSWGILLADLHAAYDQLKNGEAVSLPPKTTSYKEWAERLAAHAQDARVREERGFWLDEARREVAPVPVDFPEGDNVKSAADIVRVSLDREETQALLREVPKAYRTQIHEVLLAALAQSYSEWAGAASLLVDLEGHGREDLFDGVDLSRTVGWFTSLYPVLLDVPAADGTGELLKSVKEQVRRVPAGGIGYGLLRYLSGDEETAARMRALPRAQILFNYLGQLDQALPEGAPFAVAGESTGPAQSPRGRRPYLIEINGGIAEGRLSLDWTFGTRVHRRETVEALARGFIEALRAVIAHCRADEVGGYTPSDFPQARLNQQNLDSLLAKIKFGD
ncbi:MAG TPA: amino acid adenylation domain-containing protein [Pyrinomonadaceae bacterium]|nr:amino acid adenylation domain-containing protein [Pyrinomonadaceae bacterium]